MTGAAPQTFLIRTSRLCRVIKLAGPATRNPESSLPTAASRRHVKPGAPLLPHLPRLRPPKPGAAADLGYEGWGCPLLAHTISAVICF